MKKVLTGHPNMLKEVNKGLIKDALQKMQTATRVELSAATKISQPTVNMIINELLSENVVVECGVAKSSGGRKAVLYSLNSKINMVASVVIEEHEFQYAITDMDNNVLDSGFFRTKTGWKIEAIMKCIDEVTRKKKNIKALAIGVPGAVSESGVVSAIPKVECLEGYPLKKELLDRYDLKVTVANDINTIALGFYADNIPSSKDFACIHLGNTLGAAMVIGGRVVTGAGNFAGEIGLMQIDPGIRAKELSIGKVKESDAVLAVSKIMINMICLVNPAVLAVGGHRNGKPISGKTKKLLRENCKKVIPEEMMPEIIFMEDERTSYMEGLARLGMASIDSNLRLIRRTDI